MFITEEFGDEVARVEHSVLSLARCCFSIQLWPAQPPPPSTHTYITKAIMCNSQPLEAH